MSAIAGIYHLDHRPALTEAIAGMLAAMAGRAPEGGGSWCQGCVGLAHGQLVVTSEASAAGPVHHPERELVAVADARLDNREELASRLGLRCDEALTDGELILRAYDRWGAESPRRLLGDFAFAVWDAPRQQLLCARDHIGTKPLYYYLDQRLFAFASEIKALLALDEVPRRLNEVRVAQHLTRSFDDTESTFYRGIRRLPPAHLLTGGSGRPRRYWALDPAREQRFRSERELGEALRERLGRAVADRLRGARPVGAMLSGGLDSSAVVCLARAARPEGELYTFSAVFPDLPPRDLARIDEREFIAAVVRQGHLRPCEIRADRLSPLMDVEEVLEIEDEPIYAPNFYLHWAAFCAARERGVRVLLDGVGGDEVISHGTELLAHLLRTGRWLRLHAEARALAARHARLTARQVLWRLLVRPAIPVAVHLGYNLVRGRPRFQGLDDPVIRRSFAHRVGVPLRGPMAEATLGGLAHPREQQLRQLTSGLFPYVLELADKAAAARGVELRYPFLDRRLMELCLAVPADHKLRRGWSRYPLRLAMEGLLPPAVRWRASKADLAPNFFRQLLRRERVVIEAVIGRDTELIAPYVDLARLRAAHRRYLAQPTGRNGCAQEAIYATVMLALWLRRTGLAP